MRRILYCIAALLLLPQRLAVCYTAGVHSEPQFFKKLHLDVLPLPVFDTDPNTGQTYGAQINFLLKDSHDDLKIAISPQLTYNTLTKVGGALFLVAYPSHDSEFSLTFGMAQKEYRELELFYRNQKALNEKLFFEGRFRAIREPMGRFYGLGNDSAASAESNYTEQSILGSLAVGYYVKPHFKFVLKEEFRKNTLSNGIIASLPNTLDRFGPADGVVDSHRFMHRISAIYDSRPKGDQSTAGFYSESYFLFAHPLLASTFTSHGFGLDIRKLVSFKKDRFVLAFRGHVQKLYGEDIPFYEKSDLGGAYALRGFGQGRFVDLGRIVFSAEARIRIHQFHILGTDLNLSIDPFFEVGEVFADFSKIEFGKLQPLGGVGFRVKIPPDTTGRLDIGIGKEGPSIFIKLDYPF